MIFSFAIAGSLIGDMCIVDISTMLILKLIEALLLETILRC